MKKYRLVIFDLDGTLVNAYPAIAKSFNYTMRSMGYPQQPFMLIKRSVGSGDRKLLAPFVSGSDLPRALKIYRKHHKYELLRGSRLMPAAAKVLKRLKKLGILEAVASNRPTRFARILLKHLGLKDCFAYVLCGDKLKKMKPDGEILRKIMRELKISPLNTLYVGDMTIDVKTGKNAGVDTAAVATGSNSRKELKKERPDYLLGGLDRLLELKGLSRAA